MARVYCRLTCKVPAKPHSALMRWIIFLLPWVELFTLIQLGSNIGALSALLYVFATLVLGLTLLRAQGMELVAKLRAAENGQILPPELFVDELSTGLAAILLMIPGLVTDTLAVLFLFAPLRRRIFGALRGASGPRGAYRGPMGPDDPIEGEFRRIDDE